MRSVDIEAGTFDLWRYGTVTEDAVAVCGAFGGVFGGGMCLCVYVWWGERR
jgi:hypothetical protein